MVQLYIRDEEATIARPVRELRGFRRVHLEPGECRTVAFVLSTEHFSYVGADLRRVVEPGRVSVQVGTSSVDLPLAAELLLRGPVFELVERDGLPDAVDDRVSPDQRTRRVFAGSPLRSIATIRPSRMVIEPTIRGWPGASSITTPAPPLTIAGFA